ncbi:hypothetical protein IE53DRAFT_258505 [Violaceomyces palustris]|uniref:Uncharacterized protein n=1 Tax=Violaceomyces palustris TaxID=1673888 RepID=A0ACD0P8D4_9BASI|nr:hypothetical protein IE53DRAFT_258505 [Violaceomyces palustris]
MAKGGIDRYLDSLDPTRLRSHPPSKAIMGSVKWFEWLILLSAERPSSWATGLLGYFCWATVALRLLLSFFFTRALPPSPHHPEILAMPAYQFFAQAAFDASWKPQAQSCPR